MLRSRAWILYAGWGCAAASILHIVTIIAGPSWFDFLGAPPEYGQMMRDGDYLLPVTVTLFIAAVLAIWAAYAFSAAGVIRRLPFARFVCGATAFIFLLRGLAGIPIILWVLAQSEPTPLTLFHMAASVFIVTLGYGFICAVRALKPQTLEG